MTKTIRVSLGEARYEYSCTVVSPDGLVLGRLYADRPTHPSAHLHGCRFVVGDGFADTAFGDAAGGRTFADFAAAADALGRAWRAYETGHGRATTWTERIERVRAALATR